MDAGENIRLFFSIRRITESKTKQEGTFSLHELKICYSSLRSFFELYNGNLNISRNPKHKLQLFYCDLTFLDFRKLLTSSSDVLYNGYTILKRYGKLHPIARVEDWYVQYKEKNYDIKTFTEEVMKKCQIG